MARRFLIRAAAVAVIQALAAPALADDGSGLAASGGQGQNDAEAVRPVGRIVNNTFVSGGNAPAGPDARVYSWQMTDDPAAGSRE